MEAIVGREEEIFDLRAGIGVEAGVLGKGVLGAELKELGPPLERVQAERGFEVAAVKECRGELEGGGAGSAAVKALFEAGGRAVGALFGH